jgi:protein phosphatase 1L
MQEGSVLSESSRDNLFLDDQPTPVLSPVASPSPPQQENVPVDDGYICYVCRRRLGSAEMLKKHEELSALHQKNLRIAKQAAQRKRHEIRSDLVRLRHLMENGSPNVGKEVRKLESELGEVQTDIEIRSQSSVAEASQLEIGSYIVHVSGLSWTGNKSTNEDRMLLAIDIGDGVKGCLVADGHCGETCADYLVEHLGKNVREAYTAHKDVSRALKEGFVKTDSDFIEFAIANEVPAGSTALMCAFYECEENLVCVMAHVGDSRGLIGCNESVTRLTEDHKPDRPDEKERLLNSGGHVVDVGGVWRVFTPNIVSIGGRSLQWGLAVSRAFGDLALKKPTAIVTAEPEISSPTAVPDKGTVVLACDGIFDVMSDIETVKAAIEGGPSAVLRTAYGKLSDDNLTAIVCTVSKKIDDDEKTPRVSVAQQVVGDSTPGELHRRPSVMSEPSGKKQRVVDEPAQGAPELVPPSQQI